MAYRQEHPKPQLERDGWMNLNGKWDFQNDPGDSGEQRGLHRADAVFEREIEVPFCPQSRLSGIGETDFYRAVWYRRTVTLTPEQLSGRVVLHCGAADYEATVYVNDVCCGMHKGGYVSFAMDITDRVRAGENQLTIRVRDDERDPHIPRGKQCEQYHSVGCDYTRTTGIWQTVWLEFTPKTYLDRFRLTPDIATKTIAVQAHLVGCADLTLRASFEGADMGAVTLKAAFGTVNFSLPLREAHLWDVGCGNLYDLVFTFGEDTVRSYCGLRSIAYRDHRFFLNGRSVFQRLVLDQGFYPDGIYTAPDDRELAADIDRSMAMGFNGARLHEKVFEERFLYHCDRKGYLIWGEYPNWGMDPSDPAGIYSVLPEWLEEVGRDYNHPSIVGWCPFNETWDYHGRRQYDELLSLVYRATKAADPTRPCIDVSGGYHVMRGGVPAETDVYDVHTYEQDPQKLASFYARLADGEAVDPSCGKRQSYDGRLPFFVSEYGGIGWSSGGGWGYGSAPETEEEFLSRLKGLTDVLLDHEGIFALCYTQLTDVEQEQNGLYTYDRQAKFDPAVIHAIFARRAAVEE